MDQPLCYHWRTLSWKFSCASQLHLLPMLLASLFLQMTFISKCYSIRTFETTKRLIGWIPNRQVQARDQSWISKAMWTLIDKRVQAVKWHYSLELIGNYSKAICKSLCKDHHQRAEWASHEIEQKLMAGDITSAYNILHGWYKQSGGKMPRPTRKGLNINIQT